MVIALWVVNAILALVFVAVGAMKLLRPPAALVGFGLKWVEDMPAGVVKTIGGLEVLGAIGLIVPLATGILPILTPLAAVGLALTMIGAIVLHARRHEPVVPNLVLGAVALVSAVLGFLVVL